MHKQNTILRGRLTLILELPRETLFLKFKKILTLEELIQSIDGTTHSHVIITASRMVGQSEGGVVVST